MVSLLCVLLLDKAGMSLKVVWNWEMLCVFPAAMLALFGDNL